MKCFPFVMIGVVGGAFSCGTLFGLMTTMHDRHTGLTIMHYELATSDGARLFIALFVWCVGAIPGAILTGGLYALVHQLLLTPRQRIPDSAIRIVRRKLSVKP